VFGAAAADFWPEHGTPQERRHVAAEACAAHLEAMLLTRTIRDAGAGGLLPPQAAKALRVLGQSALPALPELNVRDSATLHRPPLNGSPNNPWSAYRPPFNAVQPPTLGAQHKTQTTCTFERPVANRAPTMASSEAPAQPSPEVTVQRGIQLEAQTCRCGAGRLVPALRSVDVYGEGLVALCNQCGNPCGLDTLGASQAPFLHCSECSWDLCGNCAMSSHQT